MIAPAFRCRPRMIAVVALSSLALSAGSVHGIVRFVDASSPGPTHNGTSWAFAYTSLATALAAANSGDEVWLANGIYKPTTTTDRTVAFQIPNGVRVFGGFAGAGVNETLLSQRDLAVNRSILSGNIGGAGDADNSFQVVRFSVSVLGATVLDGVYVTDGQADGGGTDSQGAGMRIAGSPSIRNCVFVGNVAASNGGGVFCLGDATFTNCVFSGNTANIGAAIDMQGAHINLNNCTIVNNTSTVNGGAAVRLLNGDGFSTLIRNCILHDNTAPSGSIQSQQVSISNATLLIDRSCVQGLDGSLGGSGNTGVEPRFVDPNGIDNVLGTVDDNPSLRAGSVGIDAGMNSAIPPDVNDIDDDGSVTEPLPFDRSGNARFEEDIVNNTGVGTGAIVDMGAYEFKQPVRVICVNDNAAGGGFGHTWADAHTTLQAAPLDAADIKDPAPEVIYVAQGTYKPSAPAGRSATFNMIAGVRIYGGFDDSGTQGSLSQRTPDEARAILSGDIGTPNNPSDNCFHVVTANGSNFFGTIRPTLDGFVITDGNANGAGSDSIGGGVRCFNTATIDAVFRNCLLVNNEASGAVRALNALNSDVSIINCVFSGNSLINSADTVHFGNTGFPTLINCTVANNGSIGVFVTASSSLSVANSIVVANNSGAPGDQIVNAGGLGVVVNRSCVQATPAILAGLGGVGNINTLPTFIDANGPDNIFGTSDDDYRLPECSSVIDRGDATVLPGDIENLDDDLSVSETLPFDRGGDARLHDDFGIANAGVGATQPDMGAYEHQGWSGGPCPADCAPGSGDGQVGVADILFIISNWAGGAGPADIAPLCGDDIVGVADLLTAIAAWGPCP